MGSTNIIFIQKGRFGPWLKLRTLITQETGDEWIKRFFLKSYNQPQGTGFETQNSSLTTPYIWASFLSIVVCGAGKSSPRSNLCSDPWSIMLLPLWTQASVCTSIKWRHSIYLGLGLNEITPINTECLVTADPSSLRAYSSLTLRTSSAYLCPGYVYSQGYKTVKQFFK